MPISSSIPEQTTGHDPDIGITESRYSEDRNHLSKRALTAVTPRQAELIAAIHTFRAAVGRWPAGIALARALGRNMTIVRRRLVRLERLGIVLWAGGEVRIVLQPDGVFLTLPEVRS